MEDKNKETQDFVPFEETLVEPFSVEDLAIPTDELPAGVVGRICNVNAALCSENRVIRREALKKLTDEIDYCSYLKLRAVMVDIDRKLDVFSLADAVNSTLPKTTCVVWVRVPMIIHASRTSKDKKTYMEKFSGWTTWDKFRNICNSHPQLAVALEVSDEIISDEELNRWLSEPVHCVIIPKAFFELNEDGKLYLGKERQRVLQRFFPLRVKILIDFDEPLESKHREYRSLISLAYRQWKKKYDEANKNKQSSPYAYDYPYLPRQPNLSNPRVSSYERMEWDEMKYALYEKAIEKAVLEKTDSSPENSLAVLVLGAGRGRLVEAVINAIPATKVSVNIIAVEKNRAALPSLRARAFRWASSGCKVDIVHAELLRFKSTKKVDIVVCEPFGSFGSDMLAPEYLDAAQTNLKDDGVIIPKSYRSYLVPVMNPSLYGVIRAFDKPAALENMYHVNMHRAYELDLPQELFHFQHPNYTINDTNDRNEELRFYPCVDSNLHGFAGYFAAELYNGICLSTVPTDSSQSISTWLPAFFPLKIPMMLRGGESFRVRFKRCSSPQNVWYEWAVTTQTLIASTHNLKGSSFKIVL